MHHGPHSLLQGTGKRSPSLVDPELASNLTPNDARRSLLFLNLGIPPPPALGVWNLGPRVRSDVPTPNGGGGGGVDSKLQQAAPSRRGQKLGRWVGVWEACRSGHSPPFVLLCDGEFNCGCNEVGFCPLHSSNRTVLVSHRFSIKWPATPPPVPFIVSSSFLHSVLFTDSDLISLPCMGSAVPSTENSEPVKVKVIVLTGALPFQPHLPVRRWHWGGTRPPPRQPKPLSRL